VVNCSIDSRQFKIGSVAANGCAGFFHIGEILDLRF
jgi:hypothetical protein